MGGTGDHPPSKSNFKMYNIRVPEGGEEMKIKGSFMTGDVRKSNKDSLKL